MAKKKIVSGKKPTKAQTEQFDMLFPILDSVFNEIKELSKKKQDGALNELKVKMTNRVLAKVKSILNDDPTVEFLDLLDEEPTNSDAVLIISQFRAAMLQYKENIMVGLDLNMHGQQKTKADRITRGIVNAGVVGVERYSSYQSSCNLIWKCFEIGN